MRASPSFIYGCECTCVFARQTTGSSDVTKVRIMGDSRENERRINEEVNRQGRRQKLLYEAESSARQNAAVAMKWSALFDKEIPQELLAEIELQKDTCERIIQSKDRLIKEFKSELKAKDDEYVKSLKKQAEDIDLLLERMGKQFAALRKAFEDELEEVETSFMQERHELMQSNQAELQQLMEKRKDKEEHYMEARRRRVDEDQRQLEAQRVQVCSSPCRKSHVPTFKIRCSTAHSCDLMQSVLKFLRPARHTTVQLLSRYYPLHASHTSSPSCTPQQSHYHLHQLEEACPQHPCAECRAGCRGL